MSVAISLFLMPSFASDNWLLILKIHLRSVIKYFEVVNCCLTAVLFNARGNGFIDKD